MKAPVVENGKVVVGEVMNCNFVVDHRYIDGGRCTAVVPAFRRVFEHPEEYMDSHMKKKA
jgi:pyruvate/2-oxoglutarate dehydrogenase complex dihydrolipoamide acyltransferase (E2) component